jgi:hypothetical protein
MKGVLVPNFHTSNNQFIVQDIKQRSEMCCQAYLKHKDYNKAQIS